MRQQITEEETPFTSECTGQQDLFAWNIALGKTNADAYRAAYDTSNCQNNTIWVAACRLRQHPNVALRISEYQKTIGEAKIVSLEQHIASLMRIRELCIAKGNLGAAVLAENSIGKVSGHHKEQLEVSGAVDLRAELAEIEKISPKLAEDFAKQKGIPFH